MTGPELPEPYGSAPAVASARYGCRVITLTLTGPAALHRNHFHRAWIDLTERQPWSGEVWLSAQRYASPTGHVRSSFTDTARKAVAAEVLPVAHRYGFDRWWVELHRAYTGGPRVGAEDARSQAARAAQVVRWWEDRADLVEAHAAGLVELRRVDQRPRARTVRTVDIYGRVDRVSCLASAHLDGEHVGWLTERTDLLPLDHLLADS